MLTTPKRKHEAILTPEELQDKIHELQTQLNEEKEKNDRLININLILQESKFKEHDFHITFSY